jgi:hypothetical protein
VTNLNVNFDSVDPKTFIGLQCKKRTLYAFLIFLLDLVSLNLIIIPSFLSTYLLAKDKQCNKSFHLPFFSFFFLISNDQFY